MNCKTSNSRNTFTVKWKSKFYIPVAWLTLLCTGMFWRDIKYLHFVWFLHTEEAQEFENLPILHPGGGTPYVMGDTYVPRFWPPFFTLAGSSTIFLGYFSHPTTAKLSFGVQKLPIFTKIDLFGPKFNFFLDLFGSNFQRPAAHPHQFSGRVPPPPPPPGLAYSQYHGCRWPGKRRSQGISKSWYWPT